MARLVVRRCAALGGCTRSLATTCWSGSSSSSSSSSEDAGYWQRELTAPRYFNLAKDIVGRWANEKSNKAALQFVNGDEERQVSYGGLYSEAVTLASALARPAPPRCALVILPKVPEWWVFNVAGSWCGTIISPGTSLLSPRDVSHRLSESGADCVVCSGENALKLDQVTKNVPLRIVVTDDENDIRPGWVSYKHLLDSMKGREPSPCVVTRSDDVAQLFFTSGTTGKPKMVPHTQASYGIGHKVAAKCWLDLREDDVVWNLSDTGWAKAAWSSLYAPLITGATAFVHQMSKFDPRDVLDALCRHPVSVLCAPPTAYRALVQHDLSLYPFMALRHCVSAGEPLNPEVMEVWEKQTGLQIYEGFGQTETTLLCGVSRGMEVRPGSMGRPMPGYNITIIDDNHNELGPNQEGYFAVSLKNGHPVGLFKGYLSDEAQTSKVFAGSYYLTGDRAYCDDHGYYWFVGRADDVIISSGYRIGPFEVESVLIEHPAVAESAVVSSPDKLRGEVVKAFVVVAEKYKNSDREQLARDLQDHVKNNTAPYKYPRKVEFVDQLPKTISGKIRRVELRRKEWAE